MELQKSHIKYIEWHSPAALHEETHTAISEVKFLKVELNFLLQLMENYTSDFLKHDLFAKAKNLAERLSESLNEIPKVTSALKEHANSLYELLDEKEVPDEKKGYKDEHVAILGRVLQLHAEVKKTKKALFDILKNVMRDDAQAHLLKP